MKHNTQKPARQTLGLLDEAPLLVMPTLACAFGVNDALLLQQLHYWLVVGARTHSQRIDEAGRYWHPCTGEAWQAQMPWWSAKTILRALERLEAQGLVLSRTAASFDRTKSYTIDYTKLAEKLGETAVHLPEASLALGQNDQLQVDSLTSPKEETQERFPESYDSGRNGPQAGNGSGGIGEISTRPGGVPDGGPHARLRDADGGGGGRNPLAGAGDLTPPLARQAAKAPAAASAPVLPPSGACLAAATALCGAVAGLVARGQHCPSPRTPQTCAAGLARAGLSEAQLAQLAPALGWAAQRPYWTKRMLKLAAWTRPDVWVELLNDWLACGQQPVQALGRRGGAPPAALAQRERKVVT